MKALLALLTLAMIAGCATGEPASSAPDPSPEASALQPPPLKTLQGADVAWDQVRVQGKRTVVVFSTLW